MSISLISTGIQFPDSTIQTTAAGAGGVTSLNGQTGAIVNTNLYAIGSYVIGRPQDVTNYVVNSTVAGSSFYAAMPGARCAYYSGTDEEGHSYSYYDWVLTGTNQPAGQTLVNIGSWRCVSPAISYNGWWAYAGLWVRYA